jgi:hypothetical protein
LDGIDDVKRGQIAHLDRNNENSSESNLVFLCLEHHDEYDGKTSVSKALREDEVRHWRDELYREMEYRFRTIKRHGFDVAFVGIVWRENFDAVAARFRLKNTGEITARRPVVSFRLPPSIGGRKPRRKSQERKHIGRAA